MHVGSKTFLVRHFEHPVWGLLRVPREGLGNGAKLGTQSPMDVVNLPNTKPMRCPREDVGSDSATGVWFSLYWGLCGHQMHAPPPPGGHRGGHGGQK